MTDETKTPPANSIVTPPAPIKKQIRWSRIFIWGGILLLLGAVAQKGWRIYSHGQGLLTHQTTAETLLADGWQQADPQEVVALTHDLRADTIGLINELRPFLPLTPYLEWLPRVGPLMPHAETLIRLGDNGTRLAVVLVDGLHPALATMQTAEGDLTTKLPDLLATIDQAEPNLIEAEKLVTQLLKDYETIKNAPELAEVIPGSIRQQLDEIDPLLPFAHDLLKLAPHVPELAGYPNEVTYLVVAQNSDEIRPTGGFISAVSELPLSQGQIGNFEFHDTYVLDDWSKPYDFPPQPLYDYMGSELFILRDSNFWPHFPTSAEKMISLYSHTTDQPTVDGVIAMDLKFLELLVVALEPIYVPELDATLTKENVTQIIYQAWDEGTSSQDEGFLEWWKTRKSFMGPVAQAIRTKLESDFDQVDWLKLMTALQQATTQKNLQIYVTNPETNGALQTIKWRGDMIAPEQGDVIGLIETNVGFTKVNPQIEREFSYEVHLAADHTATAVAQISYTHTGTATDVSCGQLIPTYSDGVTYEEASTACYRNYFRLLTPADTMLQHATVHPYPADYFFNNAPKEGIARQEVDTITNHTVLSNFLIVPHLQTVSTQLTYQLPEVVITAPDQLLQYRLTIHKQAGAKAYPLKAVIQLPPESTFASSTHEVTNQTESTLTFDLLVDQDQEIVVYFSP